MGTWRCGCMYVHVCIGVWVYWCMGVCIYVQYILKVSEPKVRLRFAIFARKRVLIKPTREHACKRTHTRNCICIYVCERTQTHADSRACAHARTLDCIRARNERSKLIADECHSDCDNYIPRVTRYKAS